VVPGLDRLGSLSQGDQAVLATYCAAGASSSGSKVRFRLTAWSWSGVRALALAPDVAAVEGGCDGHRPIGEGAVHQSELASSLGETRRGWGRRLGPEPHARGDDLPNFTSVPRKHF
jgi:hypothetical protein